MATSGTFTTAVASGYSIQLRWTQVSQNVAANTSSVKAELWWVASFSATISSSNARSVTINGSSSSSTTPIGSSSNIKIGEHTVTVAHDSNGTKTVALSAWADIKATLSGSYINRVSVSGSATLTPISGQKSSFSTMPGSVYAGELIEYALARADSSYTHTVKFQIGTYSASQTGVGVTGAYTIPYSWLAAMPNSLSGTLALTLSTYSGSTLIGVNNYTIVLRVPSGAAFGPSLADLTTSLISPAWGKLIQNKSKLTVNIPSSGGAYGSTIVRSEITLNNATVVSTSTTFSLPTAGTFDVTGRVTDSRGRTASKTASLIVRPYSTPAFTKASVVRALSNSVADTNGTYGLVNGAYTFSSVDGSNTVTTKVEYKTVAASTWTNAGTFVSAQNKLIGGTLDPDTQYNIRLSVSDYFGTTYWNGLLNTAFVTMDFLDGGRGIAFGKVSSLVNTFESNFAVKFNSTLDVDGVINPKGGFQSQAIPDSANLNNYTLPGWYHSNSNATVATWTNGPPANNAGSLEVLAGAGAIQYWHEYSTTTSSNTWRRRLYSGAWSAWELYAGPNLFTSGLNSNGRWWLNTVSGLLVCQYSFSANIAISSAYGSMFLSSLQTWTFPRTFTQEPTVTVGRFLWGSGASWGSAVSATGTAGVYRGYDYVSRASANTSVSLTAIGHGI